jgi:hypothetical protein
VSKVRSYKVCKVCGEGYDAFKAFDARGRYCSPACLAEARRRHRLGSQSDEADSPAVGPAILPPLINLGNLRAFVRLDPGLEGEERRLV